MATPDELTPRHNHFYNITGLPNLINRAVDVAPIAVLARIIEMVKSFADVCELGSIRETLDTAPGFDRLERGSRAFMGRKGMRAWVQMQDVVAQEWDGVVAKLDGVIEIPDVDLPADRRPPGDQEVSPAAEVGDLWQVGEGQGLS